MAFQWRPDKGSLPDGTVVKTRIDRRATNITVLAAIGVRRDGQKVLRSIMSERGSENGVGRRFPAKGAASAKRHGVVRAACAAASAATVHPHLEDLDGRRLKRPEFVIVAPEARVPRDGAPGLEAVLEALRGDDLAVQRCTVHSEGGNATGPNDRPNRNLLAMPQPHA